MLGRWPITWRVEPRYAGYVAWRGLADMAELSGKARDLLRNKFAFCLPDREKVSGYPVDGGPGSGGRYNCVWYRWTMARRIVYAVLTTPLRGYRMTTVFTIGYEGTDIDRIVATLQAVGVKVLADVRAVAVSRKKGFSKRRQGAG